MSTNNQNFNTPRVVSAPVLPTQADPRLSSRPIVGKQLDSAALETLKSMHGKGSSYEAIAVTLDKLGYVSILGLKLTDALVSNFAIACGYRARPARRASPKERSEAQAAPVSNTLPQDADAAVSAVMAWQGINKDQKRRIVAILLED